MTNHVTLPMKPGTARRLGLSVPPRDMPEPLDPPTEFERSMAEIVHAVGEAFTQLRNDLRQALTDPPVVTLPHGYQPATPPPIPGCFHGEWRQ